MLQDHIQHLQSEFPEIDAVNICETLEACEGDMVKCSEILRSILEEEAAEMATFKSWVKIGRLDMGAMELFRKHGNEIIYLSPETQKRAHELGKEWAAKIAEGNAWFKKVMESQDQFEKEWGQVGSIRYFQR